MSLGTRLDPFLLCHTCPHCGEVLEKTGAWFKTVSRYRCAGCGAVNLLSYPAKIAVFDDGPCAEQ